MTPSHLRYALRLSPSLFLSLTFRLSLTREVWNLMQYIPRSAKLKADMSRNIFAYYVPPWLIVVWVVALVLVKVKETAYFPSMAQGAHSTRTQMSFSIVSFTQITPTS